MIGTALVIRTCGKAIDEQTRVKIEFRAAFCRKLVCRGFERSETNPKYLRFRKCYWRITKIQKTA